MRLERAFPLVLALFLAGCSGKPEASNPGTDTTAQNGGKPAEPAAPVVPDNLKTAAFEYYGLGNDKMLTYSVKFAQETTERDGTQTTKLDEVKDGAATFKIERTGELSELGFETVKLDEKGVSTVAISFGEIQEASLEMPADFGVGKEWTATSTIKKDGATVVSNQKNKAVRQEKITVPAGTFDCIVVTSSGDVTTKGEATNLKPGKSVLSTTTYFAPGVGIVKMTGSIQPPNEKRRDISMVLKKIGDAAPKPAGTTP